MVSIKTYLYAFLAVAGSITTHHASAKNQSDEQFYNAGRSAAQGAFDAIGDNISPSSFQNADKYINALTKAGTSALTSPESKKLRQEIGKSVGEAMTEISKGVDKGAKESTKIFNGTLDEGSKELGKGLDKAFSNAGLQMQETFKAGGELDKGAQAGVHLYTRNINEFMNEAIHKNAIKANSIFIATVAGFYITAYGIPLYLRMLERKWTTPKLIISSSKKSWWEFFFGRKAVDPKQMIFSAKLQERLNDIINVTSTIQSKIKEGKTNVKYRNLMLYGPPGTGKTLFATELAQRSGLEYVYMSGSSFSKFKDGEGIEALDELFAWANASNKGLLIFIDEAETFLSKRENMDPQSKSAQILNNFLNYTGTRSNKFMLVFATNHKDVLDSAMYRRIDDLIEVPLPGKQERIKILNLYKQTILLDAAQNDPEFIRSALSVLNSEKIESIAEATKGLSGGELEGIFNTLKTDADICTPSIITTKLVDKVVGQAVEKYMAFTNGALLKSVED